ncbi:MAG: xanthine dehydrogenase [Chloroflexi bacterium]|nr:xanthine dehydrogenase [Chloroflexota bacterium]
MQNRVAEELSRVLSWTLEERRVADFATVISADRHAPVAIGAKILIQRDGSTAGTLGDSTLDEAVAKDAKAVLADRKSQVIAYALDAAGAPGEQVEVFHEVLEPQPQLLVVGAGHIAVPLARYGKMIGFDVVVLDDREKYANVERFPDADRVVAADFGETLQDFPSTEATYIVIITRAHTYDEEALRILLRKPAAYIGMIGSRRRVQTVLRTLAAEGYDRERLAAIHAPIGLDIGSETPEEIALAIIAEVVAVRRGGTGGSLLRQDRPVAF